MFDAKALRLWCLQVPRPKMLRVTTQDDQVQEVKAPRPGQAWSHVAATVAALQPVLVEAFDEDGTLIRATREAEEGTLKGPAPEPDIPNPLLTDPETARLTHFANLLYRSQRFATEVAFEKMASLFERMDARSASIEARLERTEANYRRVLQQQVDDAFDQAAEIAQQGMAQQSNDPKQAIMDMWIQNAFSGWMARNQGGQAPPPPGKPNGGKPNGGKG